jgi:DNA-binding CsgD family transcriptional regulator
MIHMRGWIALERGALASAEADLRAGLDMALELDADIGLRASQLALVHAEQGRPDEAERLLSEHDLTGDLPQNQLMNLVLFFRSRIRLAQGRGDDALADALAVGRRYEDWGIRRSVPAWRSLAAVLLHARGDGPEARRLAEEELDLAERWDTPEAIGLAQRGLGLMTGDLNLLRSAVESLDASPARLELARAQVELGAALRRANHRAESRGPLQAGMDAAHACGATPLAQRARDELRATGARPRRLALSGAQALTASERRVAELAARGLTNRLIAQELFVTVATVETHLRHAFQKLDVRSRHQLARALDA